MFELKSRRRKTIGIQVQPHGRIIVSAHPKVSREFISALLVKRRAWIEKRLQFFNQCTWLAAPLQYENGESHLYLGDRYQLQIHADKKTCVKIQDNLLHVYVKNPSNKKEIKKVLLNWYKEKALSLFTQRVSHFLDKFEERRIKEISLQARLMKSLWGSCSRKGKINLNIQLIKINPEYIDYVILHEICHLSVMNHSKAFYKLLDKYMPDWKCRQDKLKFFLCR